MNENGFYENLIPCTDDAQAGFAHVIHQRLGLFILGPKMHFFDKLSFSLYK